MKLHTYTSLRQDTPDFHHSLNTAFENCVNASPKLKEHRDYVQNRVFGFGERSFWWLWKLILDELPENAKLLEIGVFKGATLSLWQLLKPDAIITGVSPMDGTGLDWKDDDYLQHIKNIHADFGLKMPRIIKGLSENPDIIKEATDEYDVVYIDGGHERHHIDNDLKHYAPMVRQGGYLVIDDACCDMQMPFGYFQGIDVVTAGTVEYIAEHSEFEFVLNCVHLRCYKRK